MRKRWKATAIIATAVVIVLAVTGVVLAQGSWRNDSYEGGYGQGQGNGAGRQSITSTQSTVTPATPSESAPVAGETAAESHPAIVSPTGGALTQEEADALIFLREEEKLARDVYAVLYDKWGANVFNNITSSESQHMTSVKTLLDAYGLTDPVAQDAPGVFSNAELQAAYDSLVSQGSQSVEEAFKVGVAIENLDIEDLQALIASTTHPDITDVAQNLLKGSQNHLNAFNRQLTR